MTSKLITSKKDMKVAVLVNRNNAMTADNFEHTTLKNRDGSPLRTRRNGKTQTWKTRPEEFRIPVKHGLYDYFNITQNNCHEWTVSN
jgi:hypothetical protein